MNFDLFDLLDKRSSESASSYQFWDKIVILNLPVPSLKQAEACMFDSYACHQVARRAFPVDRGILLIRNPYEAILAEFNRKTKPEPPDFGHTLIRRPEDFKTGRLVCLVV